MIDATLQSVITTPAAMAAAQSGVLVLARVLPIVMQVPIFGSPWVPVPVRLAVGVVLSAALVPVVTIGQGSPAGAAVFVVLLTRDLLVGFTLGFAASLVFRAAESAGALVDVTRGATLARVVAPAGPAWTAPTGRFFGLLAVVLFFVIGGHQLLLAAVADSFRLLPLMQPVGRALADTSAREMLITLSASVFVLAVQLAAPAVVVALLVDLATGIFSRMVLPVNAFFLGLTLRGTLAVAATFVAMGIIAIVFRGQFADMLTAIANLTRTFAPGA